MSRLTCLVAALAALTSSATTQAADSETIGPVTFRCDDGSAIEATFDNAPEPTVHLVRGDQQATLPEAMSASGARYVGDDIEFWNKGRDATVEWQGQSLQCSEAE